MKDPSLPAQWAVTHPPEPDWKMNTEMLSYSRSKGVFAGLTLEGAVVEQDNDSTRAIYGNSMKFRNILSGKASTPKSADAFMKAVSDAGHQAKIAEAGQYVHSI